uniref:ABC1 kinase family protein n=1 Tax=Chamaesiphon sp. VAR_48_metabat_403 TaxID=2964700 RepID=UPI00286E7B34
MQALTKIDSSRQREILEILLHHGWDYMRQILTIGKAVGTSEHRVDVPPPAILRSILVDLGPVYIKLGQLLSTRPDLLPLEYIEALSELQSNVPPIDWLEIETILIAQLGQNPNNIFAQIERQPVAAGSIAQTHRAILKNGRQVALKVQRPGIERLVSRDIATIKQIAKLLSGTDFGKRYDLVALAAEFSTALLAELDFVQEARYTELLRQNLLAGRWFDTAKIMVPEVDRQLSTDKLLVLEWLDGVPILSAQLSGKNHGGDPHQERQALTVLCFRAFFQQYLVDGLFHADPHPGNLFYLNDGRIAVLDCGMMGRLDARTQSALMEMILAIVNSDAQRCAQITLQLAEPMGELNLSRLEWDYDRLLHKYNNLSLQNTNASEAFYEILQAARHNNLRWPSNIGLFAKSLANLEGVGRQFNPEINLFEEVRPLMTDMFQRQLLGDDPLQSLLRTGLELKNLSLQSPRQLAFLLDRFSSETLKLNITIQNLDGLQNSVDDAANR